MFEAHPSSKDLSDFLNAASRQPAADSSREAWVIRHLLGDCSMCRERLQAAGWSGSRLTRLFQPAVESSELDESVTPQANAYDYSRSFAAAERAVSAFLAPEQSADEVPVEALLGGLAELTRSQQVERVRSESLYATPPLVRALIERSHSVRFRDAQEMLHLAQLAKIAVERCPASLAGSEMKLADLQARVWGQLGNALRISSRPLEAEEAFRASQTCRDQGTGDPVLRAWLLERTSTLAVFQNRFDESIEMCEEAGQIYQELGDNNQLAFTLVQKAIALIYSGATESAIRTLLRAIPLIDHEDPHLLLSALHNLVQCYIDLDQPDHALTLYAEIRELYQDFDDPLITLKMTWQEGKLLRDLGHLRAAETALLHVRKGYMDRNIPYEVAVVSLDLAAVYVKLGLTNEVKKTVLTAVPIFHALRVKLDTLAALLQLQRVADQEQQAMELIRTLHSRIEALPKKSAP